MPPDLKLLPLDLIEGVLLGVERELIIVVDLVDLVVEYGRLVVLTVPLLLFINVVVVVVRVGRDVV